MAPRLSALLVYSMRHGFTMSGRMRIPSPPLPNERTLRSVMLQPSGLSLHGAPSDRSSSATMPLSLRVPKTVTFSSFVLDAPRA